MRHIYPVLLVILASIVCYTLLVLPLDFWSQVFASLCILGYVVARLVLHCTEQPARPIPDITEIPLTRDRLECIAPDLFSPGTPTAQQHRYVASGHDVAPRPSNSRVMRSIRRIVYWL